MRGHALWLMAFVALVLFGGTSMYHDARPDRVARPGFTVFAVDQAGAHAPLALFDGQAWRSACEAGEGPLPDGRESSDALDVPIAGLAGSPGAPLLRVRELTGDSAGWEPTADAVETRALSALRVSAPRKSEPRVYSADAAGTGVAYVEVVVRELEPAFRGLVASAWVMADDPSPAQLIDFHLASFGSYSDYLAIARQIPIGIVGEGDERVWVMKLRSGSREDVRLMGVGAGGVREHLRIARKGC